MCLQDNDEIERTITPEPVSDQLDLATTPGSAVTGGDNYQGLRPQELQEAKDTLIVETSDMLRVPLFTAEVLLRHHGKAAGLSSECHIICYGEGRGLLTFSRSWNITNGPQA